MTFFLFLTCCGIAVFKIACVDDINAPMSKGTLVAVIGALFFIVLHAMEV